MKLMRFLLLLLVAGALPIFAQSAANCDTATPSVCVLHSPTNASQIKPQAVPTTLTAATTVDAYLETVTVINPTGSPITFTLADRQGTPVAVLAGVSIAANTTYVIVFPSLYWCPGGFTVIAGGAGLNWYGAWRH